MAPVKKRKTENQSSISSIFKKPRGTAVDKGDEPASKGKAENGIGEIGSSVVEPIAVLRHTWLSGRCHKLCYQYRHRHCRRQWRWRKNNPVSGPAWLSMGPLKIGTVGPHGPLKFWPSNIPEVYRTRIYTRRQIKNDQSGSYNFQRFLPSILNRFPWNFAKAIFY